MSALTQTHMQEDLIEFMKVVKTGIQYGCASMSLQLIDLDLAVDMNRLILSPNSDPWVLGGVVLNPMTKQAKSFSKRFEGKIGSTSVEDVKDMIGNLIEEIRMAFYGIE